MRRPTRDPARSAEPEAIGSILDRLARERPWRAGMALGDLAARWPEVVGERLAAVSEPAGLQERVLAVRASSAAWAAQIRFLAEDVARRANEVLGEGRVREVKVILRADGGADER